MTREPNAELAYKVLDYIRAHPEEWDQRTWYTKNMCGTAACFAGWSVILAGGKIVDVATAVLNPHYRAVIDSMPPMDIEDAANDVLGIESGGVPYAARDCGCENSDCPIVHNLFGATNTLEDLEEFVEAIFGPRPQPEPTGLGSYRRG